jgi:predicted transglutaminase-like cysteine proteinase
MLKLYLILSLFILGACSAMPQSGTVLLSDGTAAPSPFGYAPYCATPSQEEAPQERLFGKIFCHAAAQRTAMQLTPDRFRELDEVQRQVNAAISYAPTTSWSPLATSGDCKTYSARKALELLERGWPAAAMRLATVFVDDGSRQQFQYHAVLLVDTDHGTLVLDSRQRAPRRWEDLRYIWMTAQGPEKGRTWVRLGSDPARVELALAANATSGIPGASQLR